MRTPLPLTHRRVLTVALPVVLSNATVPILGAVDTGVVGQMGQAAPIGAVGIGAVILATLYWVFGFLRMGTTGMVAQARGRIKEVETPDLIAMVNDPDVVIVDLRDVRERERSGSIPGSFHCPRGMAEFWVDPESPYFKEIFGQEKKFVFHCASGWRSALTAATLNDMGFRCAHLKEGFSTWAEQGGPVEKSA